MIDRRTQAANAVRERMISQGLSVAELAARAHVSTNTIRGVITGQRWPTMKIRTRIEQALGWPTGEVTRRAYGFPEPDGAASSMTLRELVLEVLRRIDAAT